MDDPDHPEPSSDPTSKSVYNGSLILAFCSNVFQLIAVSLLFRYSDLVANLGGDEWELGMIVGVSSVGAIVGRLFLGSAVDRFGPGIVWSISIALEIVALVWHLQIDSATGWEIYSARTLFALALAGNFGAWLSFVSLQAPVERVAEVIGVVGASGFVGMAIGPAIGDWIFSEAAAFDQPVQVMLYWSAATLTLALAIALWAAYVANKRATIVIENSKPTTLNPLLIVWRSRPGNILFVGAMMGMTIGFPATYLRPLAESLNIEQIKIFFLVYNIVAFVVRLSFRRAPQVLGLRNAILIGFGFMSLSMLSFMTVKTSAGFLLPAVFGGIAHSFLFPSVIAACTNRFSTNQRGIATNLILAMYDLGVFVGMPLIGVVVTWSRSVEMAPYPVALTVVVTLIIGVSIAYLLEKPQVDSKTSVET